MNNPWIISYQYWNIVFCEDSNVEMPSEYVLADSSDIARAWKLLVEEHKNVWCPLAGEDRQRVEKYVFDRHIFIEAAGGVVSSPSGKTLLISRNSHWDLPKGMMEQGETPEVAAVREVEEETGLTGPIIDKLLSETYHVYDLYGGWHIKKTYWYAMHVDSDQELHPQTEEDITECRWCTKEERTEYLEHSYAMMKMLSRLLNGQQKL